MRRSSLVSLAFALAAVPSALFLGCGGSDGQDGATGPTGPAGDQGPAGSAAVADPSISAVVPTFAFLGRTAEVLVSGYGTKFDANTTVDFGQDITVKSVTVASPTALLASIEVGTTYVGAHDVTVGSLVYKGAFQSKPPTSLTSLGKTHQGGIALLSAKQHDFESPFDLTTTGDGFFTPLEYVNISVSKFPGVDISINSATAYSVDMLALIDVEAAAGAKDIDILSGPAGNQTHNPIPGGLNIEAATPVEVTAGTPAEGTVENAYDSYLYKFTPPTGFKVIEIAAKGSGSEASPSLVLMPKSGKFADMISFSASSAWQTESNDPYYIVFWDNTGAYGYDFTITASAISPTKVPEATGDNNTAGTAQVLAGLPILVTEGELTDKDDADWYKFTAAAGDVGKKVRVRTLPGDAQADPVVDVFKTDGTTSMGGPSSDVDYHEDFTSTAITAAGDIYIRVFASSYFSASQTQYDMLVQLQ